MKKLFLSVLMIASAITFTSAQSATVGTSPEASKWSIAVKGGIDYFRVTPSRDWKHNVNGGGGLTIERTANPLWGFGLDLNYLSYYNDVKTLNTFDPTLFTAINISNLMFPHREKAKGNVYFKAGAGLAFFDHQTNMPGVSPVFTAAFHPEIALSNNVALGVEWGYRYYVREYLGGAASKDRFDDAMTLMASLRFNLGSNHVRNMTMDQYYPALPPVVKQVENPYDDSQLVNRMDNLDRQNQDIQNRLSKLESDVKDLQNRPTGAAVNASFNNIEFEFDSSKLTEASYPTLNQIASILKDNPTWGSLKVKGHTDSTGPKAYNQKLSERRAQAVKDYLVSQGVSASVITTEGYGETQPIASNDTAAGRAQNRRVEFEVVK